MGTTKDPASLALENLGEGLLMGQAVVGNKPVLDGHWLAKCGWVVHTNDGGERLQHLSFQSCSSPEGPTPEEKAPLHERVRALPLDPQLHMGRVGMALRSVRIGTVAILVELVHDETEEAVWVVYRNPALSPLQATSLIRLGFQTIESRRTAAAEMADLAATIPDAANLLKDPDKK